MPTLFVPDAVKLLETIPGIGLRVAEVIVSEIGVDMARFPTDAHLASWAGVCPGTDAYTHLTLPTISSV